MPIGVICERDIYLRTEDDKKMRKIDKKIERQLKEKRKSKPNNIVLNGAGNCL